MYTILYIGDNAPGTTAQHRAAALTRIGCKVVVRDPYAAFSKQLDNPILYQIHYRSGFRLLNGAASKWTAEVVKSVPKPDIIWVTMGELLGPDSLKILKTLGCPIVLYNNDDPTGGRDGRRFDQMLKALPYYDLSVVMRKINVGEFEANGAKKVMRVFMSYDEEAHRPFDRVEDIPSEFRSDVAFIGTWQRHENRDKFMLKLIESGVNVSIWGNRWQKGPHFEALKAHWKGNALSGREYVAAIQGAKLCLGLLSKGNRDMHTQRSLEVPFAGGVFCAERTPEHQELYVEGQEAVFWSDVDECARVCKELLNNDEKRERIRSAGMKKIRDMRMGNEDVCIRIIKEVEKLPGFTQPVMRFEPKKV